MQMVVILERIEFAVNKSIIKEESFGLLDDIAKIFNENLQIKLVEVQGHTDKRGSRFMNRRLSRRRANSVVAALVKRGVARNRMRARGYGPDKPIRNEDTEEAYQLNRRVQFVILKQIVKDTVKVDTKAINR